MLKDYMFTGFPIDVTVGQWDAFYGERNSTPIDDWFPLSAYMLFIQRLKGPSNGQI